MRKPTAFEAYLGSRRERPLSCLADVGELTGESTSAFDRAIAPDHPGRLLPRKWWEWDYIADCAEKLGLLTPGTTALGLGVGHEPLIFHFANGCGRVIASDLYSADTGWRDALYADVSGVLDASPIAYPRERVEILNADMRHTGVAEGSVDLVWSCSSIEHIPTLQDLFAVFAEIDRVLKPGGHAILTTEYCITGNIYLLPGVNAWNGDVFELFAQSLPGFEFQGAVDLSFNALHPGNAALPRRYMPVSSLPASSGRLSYVHRGGTLANPAGLSIVVPIGLALKKTSSAGIVPWEKAPVPARLRTYTEGVLAFFAGDNDEAIDKLERVYEQSDDELQLRHHIFRFLIDARARRGELQNPGAFAARIEDFLEITPEGPVQDADCLDICANLLGACGRTDQALETYFRCLLSPSTTRDHVLNLAARTLVLAEPMKAQPKAVDLVASVLADLVQFGMRGEELAQSFLQPISARLDAATVAALRNGVRDRLSASLNALHVD